MFDVTVGFNEIYLPIMDLLLIDSLLMWTVDLQPLPVKPHFQQVLLHNLIFTLLHFLHAPARIHIPTRQPLSPLSRQPNHRVRWQFGVVVAQACKQGWQSSTGVALEAARVHGERQQPILVAVAVLAVLVVECLCHLEGAEFRHRIAHHAWRGRMGGAGRQVDNRLCGRFEYHWQEGARHKKRALDVGLPCGPRVFRVEIAYAVIRTEIGGVFDQDIERVRHLLVLF